MKVEAKEMLADDGRLMARIHVGGQTSIYAMTPAELAASIPALQHAANCPPDRVRFTPEPMTWEHPTPWVWLSGEYLIVFTNDEYYMQHRGELEEAFDTLNEAQQAAERHRESH